MRQEISRRTGSVKRAGSFDKFRLKSVLYDPLSSRLNFRGGASVLVNGAVFKTVSETARAGSGRFDSYTPPPNSFAKTPICRV